MTLHNNPPLRQDEDWAVDTSADAVAQRLKLQESAYDKARYTHA